MGSMSAPDAAPLPRLGEVFFDVRGESRTMRLSWYADTGIAVFSIWQGGTCTGTFRLPIADLARMVDALRAGPPGRAQAAQAPRPTRARGRVGRAIGVHSADDEINTGETAVTPFSREAGTLSADQPPGLVDEPTGVYPGPVPRGARRSDPGTAGHSRQPRGESHSAGRPPSASRRAGGTGPGYGAESLPDFGPRGGALPADEGDYGYQPSHGEGAEGYGDEDIRRYGSGRTDRYPGEPGHRHRGEADYGYAGEGDRYRDESDPGYREGSHRAYHSGGYPDESLARPYVPASAGMDAGSAEDWPDDESVPGGLSNAGSPPPDSFPYGPPPRRRAPRHRDRDPGRD
jgi:hypothetical protein